MVLAAQTSSSFAVGCVGIGISQAIGTSFLETTMEEAKTVNKGIESTASMVEQLGKAFDELKSHNDQSKTSWQDIKDHFDNLERSLKEKYEELEEKEKAFEEKQSNNQAFLVEREADVAAKEHDLLDRLQKLKDDAVSVIADVRKNYKVELPVPVVVGGDKKKEVSSVPIGDPYAHNLAPDNLPDNRSGRSTGFVHVEDKAPRPQLKEICEGMDAKGLLKFISDNQKHHVTLRKELSLALKTAPEPARLVLDSLEGFYPPDQPGYLGNDKDSALQSLRKHCIILMESLVPLLGTTEPGGENPVKPEIKQMAKAVADEWMVKLTAVDLDASNGNSSEAQAFLQLILVFGIASDFDEDELCKLVLAVSRRRQTPELCRSLGLVEKMAGVTEALVNCGRQIDAVHFAYAFNLAERFPPAPLLKAFLDGLDKSFNISMDTGAAAPQDDKGQELTALRAIVRWVEENKLQEDYPLAPLQKRVAELKKEMIEKGVMIPESSRYPSKKPRVNSGYTHRAPGFTIDIRQSSHFVDERRPYGAGYPYTAPPPPAYENSSRLVASYGQQANVQRPYNYPEAEMLRPPTTTYAAPATGHGGYMDPSLPNSAGSAIDSYQTAGYQPAPSNYASYMSPGFQSSSHQPYL